MRSSISESGLVLLALAMLPVAGRAQTVPQLRQEDRVRIAEARRIAHEFGEQVWPGWSRTGFEILLVGDSAEFLIGHARPSADFTPLGKDAMLASDVWTRARQFPPSLLATFPAVSGVPTIVIGSAERTGKSPTAWVLTLLHEHFHQWQYSLPGYYAGVARLDLARGDTTGQWMLDYPFPYDSAPVQQAMHHLASVLARALDAPPGARSKALKDVIRARDTLRTSLSAADYRYFEFQLWQEGVAHFIEYSAARAAAKGADGFLLSLRRELKQLDLAQQRRVAFYPIGAAMALVLERTRADWRQLYTRRLFTLAALLKD